MKQIQFSNNPSKYTLVDDDDFDRFSHMTWRHNPNYTPYAFRQQWYGKKIKTIFLHRLILGLNTGDVCDHINRDPLDNRKENLRRATLVQNLHNSGPRVNSRSGFKCVFPCRKTKGWVVKVRGFGVTKEFYSKDFMEAVKAANRFASELHGQFAFLNTIPSEDQIARANLILKPISGASPTREVHS